MKLVQRHPKHCSQFQSLITQYLLSRDNAKFEQKVEDMHKSITNQLQHILTIKNNKSRMQHSPSTNDDTNSDADSKVYYELKIVNSEGKEPIIYRFDCNQEFIDQFKELLSNKKEEVNKNL